MEPSPSIIHCPACSTQLSDIHIAGCKALECSQCLGRLVNTAVVRNLAGPQFIKAVYAGQSHSESTKTCPTSRKFMLSSPVTSATAGVEVDFCRCCQVVWFDCGEFDAAKSKNSDSPAYGKNKPLRNFEGKRNGVEIMATRFLLNGEQPMHYTPSYRKYLRGISVVILSKFYWEIFGHPRLQAIIWELYFVGSLLPLGFAFIWFAPSLSNYVGYGYRSRFLAIFGAFRGDPMAFVNRSTPAVAIELFGFIMMVAGYFLVV